MNWMLIVMAVVFYIIGRRVHNYAYHYPKRPSATLLGGLFSWLLAVLGLWGVLFVLLSIAQSAPTVELSFELSSDLWSPAKVRFQSDCRRVITTKAYFLFPPPPPGSEN